MNQEQVNEHFDRLKVRIEGRQEAEAFLAMCQERGPDFMKGVQAACAKIMPAAPEPERLSSMDDKESRAFERQQITFGVHQGKTFADVPVDYLCWLSDQTLTIQRYLRSERGLDRISRED